MPDASAADVVIKAAVRLTDAARGRAVEAGAPVATFATVAGEATEGRVASAELPEWLSVGIPMRQASTPIKRLRALLFNLLTS
jgi:hypothetical protein